MLTRTAGEGKCKLFTLKCPWLGKIGFCSSLGGCKLLGSLTVSPSSYSSSPGFPASLKVTPSWLGFLFSVTQGRNPKTHSSPNPSILFTNRIQQRTCRGLALATNGWWPPRERGLAAVADRCFRCISNSGLTTKA